MSMLLIATVAMILDGDYILLTRNQDEVYGSLARGLSAGIGGFRKTSNPDQAVVEEVKGDIGCIFKGELHIVHPYFEPPGKPPVTTLFYLGEIIECTLCPVCSNVLAVNYFHLDLIPQMDLRYNHKTNLEALLKKCQC